MKANLYINAKDGCIFVLTSYGYKVTPDEVKPERAIGEPVPLFEYRVPVSWVDKGYVEMIAERKI